MPDRTAKIVPAVVASLLAGAALTTLSHSAAGAADECLSGPNDQAPQGSHWYYRIDHATNRQCWYLKDQSEKPSQQAAQPDPWSSARAPSPKAETATRRPASEARAELTPRINVEQPNQVGPTAAKSAGAAVNPISQDTNPPAAQTQPTNVSDADADVSAASTQPNSPLAAGQFAPAGPPPETPPTHSVQTLLAAILGALALAGVMGRVIFEFVTRRPVKRRGRRRRGAIWKSAPKGRRIPATMPRRIHVPRDLDQVDATDDRVAELFAQMPQRSRRAPS